MTRILVFSPYAIWTIHTIYEKTIAQACQVRGAEVEYLLCDGLLPECDLHWDSKADAPRPFDLCHRCQHAATADMHEIGISHRRLGEYVDERARSEAFTWAQSLTPDGFRDASFEGAPVGHWVLSSVISYFRKYPPDLSNWHVVNVYRGFLYSAAIAFVGLKNYLDSNDVAAALLFNGRQSVTRVALELFRQRGIRVLTHERAEYNRGHINVKPNAHCMSLAPFWELWSKWAHVPLKRDSLEAAQRWLNQRQNGINLAWIPFNNFAEPDLSLRQRLNLSQNGRLWALFTSSTDETAGDPEMKGPYDSQIEWVGEVVRWVSMRDDVELVIKVHPNLGGNLYIGKAVDELQMYQKMKAALPSNVRIVLPDDSVSAYSLAKESDAGLTFGSIMGLEMAMLGKPVLVASRALYENGSMFLTVRSKDSLPEMLERCMHVSENREIMREAFRLAYYYLYELELPFPLITVLNIYEAKLSYSQKEELIAGCDPSMDRICNYLIEGSPLFDSPTPEESLRSLAEEDAFFEDLKAGRVIIETPASLVNEKLSSPSETLHASKENHVGGSIKNSISRAGRVVRRVFRHREKPAASSEQIAN